MATTAGARRRRRRRDATPALFLAASSAQQVKRRDSARAGPGKVRSHPPPSREQQYRVQQRADKQLSKKRLPRATKNSQPSKKRHFMHKTIKRCDKVK